jgi:chlorobactene glucosyltransferase
VLWVLALGRTILNLILMPRLSAEAQPQARPLVSVVIPARNESAVIERTVGAFLAQDYGNLEIVVVDDRSTDATRSVLASLDDARLRVIDGAETPPGWLGKPWALEQGSRSARGDIILFVDADLFYPPAAVRAAVAELQRSGGALIGLLPYFEMHGFGEHVGMGMLAFTPALFPVWLFNRVQWKYGGLGGGSGNMITREALEGIGHFSGLRDAVIDDVGLARAVRESGRPTYMVRAEHLIRVRMYHGVRQVIDGFTKNAFAGVGRSYAAAAVLMVLMVFCHLAPYWWAVLGDPFAIATVILISLTRAILFRATGYSLANAIFLHPLMILLWAYIFLRSVWFTGIRSRVQWRGRVYEMR